MVTENKIIIISTFNLFLLLKLLPWEPLIAQHTNFTETINISILICPEIFIEIGLVDFEL